MARVLVTGMSGTGKSTLLHSLRARGYRAVDTDDGGWVGADGTWDEPRMDRLLAAEPTVVVAGTVDNQGRFYDRSDHVVLLGAPLDARRPAAEIADHVEALLLGGDAGPRAGVECP